MKSLIVRDIVIGEGIPKICVSLTAKTKAELLKDAEAIVGEAVSGGSVVGNVIDLVEWRVDHFEELNDINEINDLLSRNKLLDILADLRRIIGNKPLIFTYRSIDEGGAGALERLSDHQISDEQISDEQISDERRCYTTTLKTAIDSGMIDLVDVELFMGDETVMPLIAYAHAQHVKVIVSNHDFAGTPKVEEIVKRLQNMQMLGGDILKIAVMPSDRIDVLALLEATVIMSERYADRPIVTMSMSECGAISRVTGEVFGSSITFGTLGKSSAPGQIKASELSEMLIRMHHLL